MNIANKISEVLVMKKFLKATAIVLVIAMIACFAACGGDKTNNDADANENKAHPPEPNGI